MKKSTLIHEGVGKAEELRNLLLRNQGKKVSINERAPWLERLNQQMSYKHEWILKNLPESSNLNILDVGAWTGMLSYLLHRMGHKVTAFDLNQKVLDEINKNIPKVKTICGDAQELSFKSNTFDVVIGCQVLEHIKDDVKALSEWNRVLKPGGLMIVTVPIQKNLLSQEHFHFYDFYKLMDLFDTIGENYKIAKINKFDKYARPKNIFAVKYIKGGRKRWKKKKQ